MQLYYTDNFNYLLFDEGILAFVNKTDIAEMSKEAINIAKNTVNTWQPDRTDSEKISNTSQGKIAENMFSDYIECISQDSENKKKFMAYDDFRKDAFQKHAPFDGLVYESSNVKIQESIEKVNSDVKLNDYGAINTQTRKFMRANRIYTVEIKSSKIPRAEYDLIKNENFKSKSTQEKLLKLLKQRDLFVYPIFSRNIGRVVNSFNEYCQYVKNSHADLARLDDQQVVDYIIRVETENVCDIYTRVFVDNTSTSSYIGYLTSYALGMEFFREPQIMKMPQRGKSENAIYYSVGINKGEKLINILQDERLW